MSKKLFAEFFGTFWLVFGGCGSAIFAASVNLGIGYVGVAFAFGLTVLTMAYAVGHISGGHFNPAVTLGLVAGGRFSAKDALPYIVSQVVGGLAAGAALYLIASGKAGFDVTAGFASNGYGDHSPEGYSLEAVFVAEVLLTAFFLLIIMGSTHKNAAAGSAPNTSVNPARSTAVAVFQGSWAIDQLWLFWVAPIIGGILGGIIYRTLLAKNN